MENARQIGLFMFARDGSCDTSMSYHGIISEILQISLVLKSCDRQDLAIFTTTSSLVNPHNKTDFDER